MFRGRHLTRLLTCLLVLLGAGCGRSAFEPAPPASLSITVKGLYPPERYELIWIGQTPPLPAIPSSQASDSETVPQEETSYTFPTRGGLQLGSWSLGLTVIDPAGTQIILAGTCPSQELSSGANYVTITVSLSAQSFSCSSPHGGARPVWPPAKR